MSLNNINNFWDLDTWKKGHKLVIDIYKLTKRFPKEEIYGLSSQIRRSASSTTANIAEGFSRYSFKDKVRFYYQARGSISETQNHLLLAKSIKYISEEDAFRFIESANEVKKMLNGLIKSTMNQL